MTASLRPTYSRRSESVRVIPAWRNAVRFACAWSSSESMSTPSMSKMIACVLFMCSTIGLISTLGSHILAQSRDTYKQRGKEPERIVQTNSFGQEANYGRPQQHAAITCGGQGGNSKPLWHRVLRTRTPKQDGHDVCGSKAYQNE